MDKWSTSQTIRFLENYKEHVCLWNYNDKDYRNRKKRLAALEELTEYMNLPGLKAKEAQNKIHSLRNTYLAEKKKVVKSKMKGSGVDDIYVPKLPWFDIADTFLNNIIQTRKSETNLDILESSDLDAQKSQTSMPSLKDETCNEAKLGTSTLNPRKVEDAVTRTAAAAAPAPTKTTKISSTAPATKRKRQRSMRKDFAYLNTGISTLRGLKSRKKESEFDSFGRSVVDQLDKLPLEMAYEVQEKIQKILSQKKIEALRMRTGSSSIDRVSTPLSTDESIFFFSPSSKCNIVEVISQDVDDE